jgi:hypothetical protein
VHGASAHQADKRIATTIDATLDKKADNVKLLLSRLRRAARAGEPHIFFSGMRMIESIKALVTSRTIGEINLEKEGGHSVSAQQLKAGASINETRLTIEDISKRFALRTAAERAVPNALHHKVIAQIPNTGDATLAIRKRDYEDKLYKAEMHGDAPPWTLEELGDEIGVDLARTPPAKEVSNAERPPLGGERKGKCSNCGGDHHSKDCPRLCKGCGKNFCPGARDELCAVAAEDPPSKSSLKNFRGSPLPDFLVAKLEELWKQKHPGVEVSVLEAWRHEVAAFECDSEGDVSLGVCIPCSTKVQLSLP